MLLKYLGNVTPPYVSTYTLNKLMILTTFRIMLVINLNTKVRINMVKFIENFTKINVEK